MVGPVRAAGRRGVLAAGVRSLSRTRQSLRTALDAGFVRLVFARPADGTTAVVEAAEATTVEALVTDAAARIRDGFVKLTVVRADGARVVIDARHGGAKELPPPTAERAGSGRPLALAPVEHGPLLRVLGIQNADGSISAQNAKKFKQVNHLVELLRPAWEAAARRGVGPEAPLRILDLACGNAYLSFVLADALRAAGVPFRLHGVDVREDLVSRCAARAQALSLSGVTFSVSTIAGARDLGDTLGGSADLVLALHACDGATDEALRVAVDIGAAALFVVPCCQAELAAELRRNRGGPTPAYRHGLLLREHAATLTDALRVDWLEAHGFEVDVLEFVDVEHTPKNRLLRAHRRRGADPAALQAWHARCDTLGAHPRGLGGA